MATHPTNDTASHRNTASSIPLLVCMALAVAGFNIGVYSVGFGIGYGIFLALTATGIFVALPSAKKTPLTAAVTLTGIVSGLLIGYRDNLFVRQMCLAVSSGSIGLLMLLASVSGIPETIWQFIAAAALYAIHGIFTPFRVIQRMGERQDTAREAYPFLNPFRLLKTVILTIVVVAVFSGLLISADPIFKQMVESLLRQALGRMTWSVILVAAIGSGLTIVLTKTEKMYPELRFLSAADIAVPVLLLIGLFGLFLSVQAKYLFASHELFRAFNLTYSEYVRKGFEELLVATGFGSVISYILILKRRAIGRQFLTWVNVVLILELVLLLVSAWRRDMMYIEVYGLTRMRIIGEVFLFWLAGNLGMLLLLSTWNRFAERHLLAGLSVMTLGALAYFNTVNMDMRIASVAPKRDNAKDLFYLANLSADSAPVWTDLVASGERVFADLKDRQILTDEEKIRLANTKLAMYSLIAQRERLDKKFGPLQHVRAAYGADPVRLPYESAVEFENRKMIDPEHRQFASLLERQRPWQAYTVSEYQAYRLLDANRSVLFGRVDALLTGIYAYQKTKKIDLSEKERWILYDFRYPFLDTKIRYYPITVDEFLTPTPAPSK